MPHTLLLFAASAVLVAGCAEKKAPETPPTEIKQTAPTPERAPSTAPTPTDQTPSTPVPDSEGVKSFSALAPSMVPTSVKTKGTVNHAIEWSDKQGRNIVTFTAIDKKTDGYVTGRRLHIYHDVVDREGSRRLRVVKDGVNECEFDVHAKIVKEAIGVTDLDGDGINEVTFAYLTTCTSDVSPQTLKLLLMEDGAKYIIRGTNRIHMGEGQLDGGEKKVDPTVTKGPPAFARHLEMLWNRVVGPWSPQGVLEKKR